MDHPVPPAVVGTFPFPEFLRARYTAGPPSVTRPVLADMLARRRRTAVDIETFGLDLDARRIKCVTVSDGTDAVILDPRTEADQHTIRTVFELATELVFHNSPFDVPNLFLAGLLSLEQIAKVTDTLIYARLAFPDQLERKSLDALSKRLLGWVTEETTKSVFKRLGYTIAEGYKRLDINSPLYLMGAAVDTIATYRIVEPLKLAALDRTLKNHPFSVNGIDGEEARRLLEREQQLNRMSLRRSCRGLRIDTEFLDRYQDKTRARRAAAEAQLESAGIRPGNAGDLIKVLEDEGTLPEDWPRTAKTGRPSTTADNLERLGRTVPIAGLYVHAKQIAKIENDYLGKCASLASETGRIHPEVQYLVATTGRMSYGGPPLQQFPEDARGIVLADDGDQMTSLDWRQIEPVTAAYLARDTELIDRWEQAEKSDIYATLAARIYGPDFRDEHRKVAKIATLAQLYGEGLGKLAADLQLAGGVDEARQLRRHLFDAMPQVERMLYRLRDIGEQHRKIFTLSGRILTIPMGKGFDGGPPQVATHKSVNYFVQGSAYDLLAEAALGVEQAGLGDAVYLLMHDEIVCSTTAAEDVQRIMLTPPARMVELAGRMPILRSDRADLGKRWAKT